MLILGVGTKNSGQIGPLPRAEERTHVSGDHPPSLGNLVLLDNPKTSILPGEPQAIPRVAQNPKLPPKDAHILCPHKGCPDSETAFRDNQTTISSLRMPRLPRFPQGHPDPMFAQPPNHPDTPMSPQNPPAPPRPPLSPSPSPCSQGGSGSGQWSHHRPPHGGRGSSAGTRARRSQGSSSHCSRARPIQGGKRTPRASGDSWGCTLRTPVLPVWGTGSAGKGLCKQRSTKHLPQVGIKCSSPRSQYLAG